MRYHDVEEMSREQLSVEFSSDDDDRVAVAPVSAAYYEGDWHWVQEQCLELLKGDRSDLRRVAATCFGHLARIHGTIDGNRVVPVLQALKQDPQAAGARAGCS